MTYVQLYVYPVLKTDLQYVMFTLETSSVNQHIERR